MFDKVVELRNKYEAELERLRAEIRGNTEVRTEFASKFQWFFENNPTLDKFSFTGSIPYFNDGEPCVFGLGGVEVLEVDSYGDTEWTDYSENDSLNQDLCKIAAFLDGNIGDDALQFLFGDNFRVIIHRDGTLEEEDYHCGY